MVVVATRCRRTHQTRTSPLVRVQLFQKLCGYTLFVIPKKSHIFSFYIHVLILYLYFCYTLYIYIYMSVFRKTSFSGLVIRFFSCFTKSFKFNTISSLVNRGFNIICSNYKLIHQELQLLTSFFHSNDFPLPFIEAKIKAYFNRKYQNITTYYTNEQKLLIPMNKNYILPSLFLVTSMTSLK